MPTLGVLLAPSALHDIGASLGRYCGRQGLLASAHRHPGLRYRPPKRRWFLNE
jgi:hypothetical protein